ncbi:MAG: hypothetical protein IPL23_13735 [Saprospiraceae bacterium]|nr:hypothetical protein [Saprospiraceae bacterium]MBP7642958.1 hypothetical protein [Saprospiraceae bacterium]HMS69806.1 hypothetical protein [Saprospiraceae bacterium]
MKNVFILFSFLLITFNVSATTFKTEIVHNDENVIGYVSNSLDLVEAINMHDFTEIAVSDKSYLDNVEECSVITNSCCNWQGWFCYNYIGALLDAIDVVEELCNE